jgi:hypothetical protein
MRGTLITAPHYNATLWSLATHYEDADGVCETLEANPGVRRFVFKHLITMHRILHRAKIFGTTFSGKKLVMCAPEIEMVGGHVSYTGHIPDDMCVKVISDWPPCKMVFDVRSFLGTCGVMRIFIKDFTVIARPLVRLTIKGAEFLWTEEHQQTMDIMKKVVCESTALRQINYTSKREVILAVDTSWMAVGYLLLQIGNDCIHYLYRFGSLVMNKREARYSQPKLELYGLFRALKDVKLSIIGVQQLTAEMDASCVKGC